MKNLAKLTRLSKLYQKKTSSLKAKSTTSITQPSIFKTTVIKSMPIAANLAIWKETSPTLSLNSTALRTNSPTKKESSRIKRESWTSLQARDNLELSSERTQELDQLLVIALKNRRTTLSKFSNTKASSTTSRRTFSNSWVKTRLNLLPSPSSKGFPLPFMSWVKSKDLFDDLNYVTLPTHYTTKFIKTDNADFLPEYYLQSRAPVQDTGPFGSKNIRWRRSEYL